MADFKVDQFVLHRAVPVWGHGRIVATSLSYVSVRFAGSPAEKQFQLAMASELLEIVERNQVSDADQTATRTAAKKSSKAKTAAKAKAAAAKAAKRPQ